MTTSVFHSKFFTSAGQSGKAPLNRTPQSHGASGQLGRDTDVRDTLVRLDTLARVMDSAIKIPGTNVVMGADALLGLLPVVGDAISGVISSYVIWEARRLGVSRLVMVRMVGNTAIDTIVGSVPFVGDLFDVAYKANTKNITLLRRHLEKHGASRAGTIEASYSVEG